MDKHLVFIVDDDYSLRRLLEVTLQSWGYNTQTWSSGETLLKNLDAKPDVVLLDHMLPGMSGLETLEQLRKHAPDLPVIILSAQSKIDVAIGIMRAGASDYFTKPVDLKRLRFSLNNAVKLRALSDKVQALQDTLESTVRFDNIISNSGAMQAVLKMVEKACRSDITVLIEGESGTGKELIARAIHFNGTRKRNPFVVINCAAIPRDLLESELFGHERGAFTGAYDRKIGKFEAASGGTIFLDEIGEMDLSLQAKLLRVLQTKQFERVGGVETIVCDTRIVSATNRTLRDMVAEKLFREDLYYRLSTFPILLPPLRERAGEITLLAEHFLTQFAGRENKSIRGISSEAMHVLTSYPWPGNVRELQSVIERSVLMAEGEEILPDDLPIGLRHSQANEVMPHGFHFFATRDDVIPFEQLKEMIIREALEHFDGNITDAARALDMGRTTLYDMVRRLKPKG